MSSSLISCAGLWCAFLLLLTACDRSDPSSPSVQEDIYLEASIIAVPVEHITNDIAGNVTIVVANNNLLDGDFVATGTGADAELARIEAQEHLSPTNSAGVVRIRPLTDTHNLSMNQRDQVWEHVRVPPGFNLPDVHTRSGNIDIHGAVGNVTATISNNGNIEVMGGFGDVDLFTERGSITIDLIADRTIRARANEGNIEITAKNATVEAETTGGNVRFIGSLRSGVAHTLATTAGGNITVALPADASPAEQPPNTVLRIYAATASQPIVLDYPAHRKTGSEALVICGVVHSSGPYDYHVENTSFVFGRLEISSSPTLTHVFTGTLAENYFRFDTTEPHLSLFTPRAQAIHIYTAAEYAEIAAGKTPVDADCQAALADDPKRQPAIEVNLRSGSGRIFVHLSRRQ